MDRRTPSGRCAPPVISGAVPPIVHDPHIVMNNHPPSAPPPTPSTPSPRLVVVHPRTQRNPRPKAQHRRRYHVPAARSARPHLLWLILRNEHHLRIRRLHHHYLNTALLLHRYRLVLVTVERASGKRVLAQSLNRRHHRLLVGLEHLPQRGIVVHIRCHHIQHGRKIHQRDERRIEPMLLRRIRQRLSLQVAILPQPIVCIEDLLRVCRSRTYLRHQRIRKQRKRSHQLFQLVRRRSLSVSRATRPEAPHRNQERDYKNLAKGHRVTPLKQFKQPSRTRRHFIGQVILPSRAATSSPLGLGNYKPIYCNPFNGIQYVPNTLSRPKLLTA
jgi:hypothetical protein